MEDTRKRVALFVYHFAVVVSGMWVSSTYNVGQGWVLFVIAGALGLLWTVYYEFSMAPRLATLAEREDSESERGAASDREEV